MKNIPIDKRYKYIFFSILITFLLSHSMMIFNKYAFHDEAYTIFNVGGTYELGRWGLAFTSQIVAFIFGSEHATGFYSLPIMAAIYTILFVTLSVCLIVTLLNIKNKVICCLLGSLFISSPYFASLFGYTYTTAYYMFSLFLSILGAYLICFYKKWKFFLLGILILILSLSIYQAFFSFSISLILFYFIKETLEDKQSLWKTFFLKGTRYIIAISSALFLYLLITWMICHLTGIHLSNYKGIDKMGTAGLLHYLKLILPAYHHFFFPKTSIFNFSNILFMYHSLLVLTLFMIGSKTVELFKKNKAKIIQFLLLICCIPFAINFIYIGDANAHMLMIYVQIMFFVFAAYLYESKVKYFNKIIYGFMCCCFCLIILMQVRTNNIIYLKIEFMQSRMISYFTTLVTRIKSIEGYQSNYPVVYINEFFKNDNALKELNFQDYIILPFGRINRMINNYSWKQFMDIWCGYNPKTVNNNYFRRLPEVQQMPRYPNDGSIRIINQHIVIKF